CCWDSRRSLVWYQAAWAPLRYGLLMQFAASVTGHADVAGFGEATSGKPDFWVSAATPEAPAHRPAVHVAFRAPSRSVVDAFYKAALAAGGVDNGGPGTHPRTQPARTGRPRYMLTTTTSTPNGPLRSEAASTPPRGTTAI